MPSSALFNVLIIALIHSNVSHTPPRWTRVIVVAALAEHYGADLGAVVNAQPTAALSPERRAIVRLFEDHLTPAPVCRS
jgi:hypothetical protein